MAINDPLLAQRRQEELALGRAWLDAILAGQMPQGFVPTLDAWGQVLGLLGDVAADRGLQAVQPAWSRWVEPALSGVLGSDLQFRAMNILANAAQQTQQLDPRLLAFLQSTPQAVPGFVQRAQLLSRLAPTFSSNPQFQQTVARFLQTAAPGGSVAGMPAPVWAAAAQPFFAMQTLLGPQGMAQAGLPTQIQFPQATNLSRQAENVLRAIQDAALAAQGLQIGPEGVVRQTPAQLQATALDVLDPLWREMWGNVGGDLFGFGTPTGISTAVPASPEATALAPTAAPAAPAAPTRQAPQRGFFAQAFQDALSNIRQVVQGFSDVAPLGQLLLAAYQAQGLSPAQLEQALEQHREELVSEMGEDAYRRLLNWVRGVSRG